MQACIFQRPNITSASDSHAGLHFANAIWKIDSNFSLWPGIGILGTWKRSKVRQDNHRHFSLALDTTAVITCENPSQRDPRCRKHGDSCDHFAPGFSGFKLPIPSTCPPSAYSQPSTPFCLQGSRLWQLNICSCSVRFSYHIMVPST